MTLDYAGSVGLYLAGEIAADEGRCLVQHGGNWAELCSKWLCHACSIIKSLKQSFLSFSEPKGGSI